MNNHLKRIILFAITAIIVTICIWPEETLLIKQVIDGNTIKLQNGATVRLLGVSSTVEGKFELQSLLNKEVLLKADRSSFFDIEKLDKESVVYAYMLLPEYNYKCVNASLLRSGRALLLDNCPDSLEIFKFYASSAEGSNQKITPTPTPVEPIDYKNNDIILPQYVSPGERKHNTWYSDGNLNLEMLEEACDFNLPYTKAFANSLAAKDPGDYSRKGIDQVCEIFKYCYDQWRYVSDPAEQEYLARASETISASLTGDCDDFAILLSSCVLAVGGNARITTAYTNESGHAFTEVEITGMNLQSVQSIINSHFPERNIQTIATKSENGRLWLNLDWQSGYPGGKYWDYDTRSVYSRIGNKWKWDGNFNN